MNKDYIIKKVRDLTLIENNVSNIENDISNIKSDISIIRENESQISGDILNMSDYIVKLEDKIDGQYSDSQIDSKIADVHGDIATSLNIVGTIYEQVMDNKTQINTVSNTVSSNSVELESIKKDVNDLIIAGNRPDEGDGKVDPIITEVEEARVDMAGQARASLKNRLSHDYSVLSTNISNLDSTVSDLDTKVDANKTLFDTHTSAYETAINQINQAVNTNATGLNNKLDKTGGTISSNLTINGTTNTKSLIIDGYIRSNNLTTADKQMMVGNDKILWVGNGTLPTIQLQADDIRLNGQLTAKNIVASDDSLYDIGTSAYKFRDLYLSNGINANSLNLNGNATMVDLNATGSATIGGDVNIKGGKIGDLANLNTTDKATIIGSVNEVNSNLKDFIAPFKETDVTQSKSFKSIDSKANVALTGNTMQNFCDGKVKTHATSIELASVNSFLKTSTVYTVIIYNLNITGNSKYSLGSGQFEEGNIELVKGTNIIKITMKSSFINDARVVIWRSTTDNTADTVTIDNCVIVEGEEIPNGYFEGIKHFEATEFKTTGKNLFSGNVTRKVLNNDTGEDMGTTLKHYSSDIFELRVRDNLTISCNYDISYTEIMVFEFDANKKFIKKTSAWTTKTLTISLTKGTKYVRLSVYNETEFTYDNFSFQVEVGTIVTSYEPYKEIKQTLTQPLTLGKWDSIDYEGNKVIGMGKYVIDGSVVQQTADTSNGKRTIITSLAKAIPGVNARTDHFYCDGLKKDTANNTWTGANDLVISINEQGAIDIVNKSFATNLQGFRDWLKANPITVYYQLSNPTVEVLETITLNSYNPITNIFNNSIIPPISQKIKYVDISKVIDTIGSLSNLETTNKDSIVEAINELKNNTGDQANALVEKLMYAPLRFDVTYRYSGSATITNGSNGIYDVSIPNYGSTSNSVDLYIAIDFGANSYMKNCLLEVSTGNADKVEIVYQNLDRDTFYSYGFGIKKFAIIKTTTHSYSTGASFGIKITNKGDLNAYQNMNTVKMGVLSSDMLAFKLGNLYSLSTTNKDSLVGAINELKTDLGKLGSAGDTFNKLNIVDTNNYITKNTMFRLYTNGNGYTFYKTVNADTTTATNGLVLDFNNNALYPAGDGVNNMDLGLADSPFRNILLKNYLAIVGYGGIEANTNNDRITFKSESSKTLSLNHNNKEIIYNSTNGYFKPDTGNTGIDLGGVDGKWKDLWLSGNANINGNLTVASVNGKKQWTGTKAQYDAITTKDPNTLYFVLKE